VVVALGGSAVAVSALASELGLVSEDNTPNGPPPEKSATTSVDPRLERSFSILRRARNDRDAMGSKERDAIVRIESAGGNPDLARRADAANGDAVFVVPGNNAACYWSPGNGGCVSVDLAQRGFAVGLGATNRGIKITGLAPDGFQSASLDLADGRTVKTRVADNVYTVDADDVGTASVTLEGPAGRVIIPFSTAAIGPRAEERDGRPVPLP
jgi:hypothetical protein